MAEYFLLFFWNNDAFDRIGIYGFIAGCFPTEFHSLQFLYLKCFNAAFFYNLRVSKFNPLYYILTGYREALINGTGFWEGSVHMTLYFWGIVVIVLLIGIKVYKTLRVHFADLL